MFSAKKKLLFLSLFLLIAAVSGAQLVNLSCSPAYELLTNAMKYTFDKNTAGEISISLAETINKGELFFRISDNARGKPENVLAKGTGFGTELINLLVQQLDGQLTSANGNGTTINILFKYSKKINGTQD